MWEGDRDAAGRRSASSLPAASCPRRSESTIHCPARADEPCPSLIEIPILLSPRCHSPELEALFQLRHHCVCQDVRFFGADGLFATHNGCVLLQSHVRKPEISDLKFEIDLLPTFRKFLLSRHASACIKTETRPASSTSLIGPMGHSITPSCKSA